jgi:hypothetical protein
LYPEIGLQLRIPQNTTKILQDFDNLNKWVYLKKRCLILYRHNYKPDKM